MQRETVSFCLLFESAQIFLFLSQVYPLDVNPCSYSCKKCVYSSIGRVTLRSLLLTAKRPLLLDAAVFRSMFFLADSLMFFSVRVAFSTYSSA